MLRFGPTTRTELIRCLRQLGFQGPYSGGKHQFMVKEHLRVRIPNPHRGDIASGEIGHVSAGREAGVWVIQAGVRCCCPHT
jgi:predicted RNA binding protein YcfA (HicA-like mRNA interferase family)